MKWFLGCLWGEPTPKSKAVFCLCDFCMLPPGLPPPGRKALSIRGFGIFCHCKHIYCIALAVHWLQLPLKRLLKKYEICTLVSCLWFVKLWIKVPKLCISHWCVNLVKVRGEQLIFMTDRYSISACVCFAWLLSLSVVITSTIHIWGESESLSVGLSWRNGGNSFLLSVFIWKNKLAFYSCADPLLVADSK